MTSERFLANATCSTVIAGALLIFCGGLGASLLAQPGSGAADQIMVSIRSDDRDPPSGVSGPDGDSFDRTGSKFVGRVPRPTTGVEFHDLEVSYGTDTYPLRIRIHPNTKDFQLVVGLDRPKSCANVHLKRLEKPTPTQTASVRAAFTLGYMIDGRSGANSCDDWPLRAAKARFDRYYNAMERSTYLVIPEGVKSALKAAATNDVERRRVDRMIAQADGAERRRLASSLQRDVLTAVRSGDTLAAYQTSALLSETASKPEYSGSVSSEISPAALDKQTEDLRIQAGVPPVADNRTPGGD